MQLGIAARQIDRVRLLVRRLVGERREGGHCGAGGAPAVSDVRVGEGEGEVAGDGDALAERRQRRQPRPWVAPLEPSLPGQADQPVDIEMRADQAGGAIEEFVQAGMLGGLDQAEMPFGERQPIAPRQAAEHGETERRRRLAQQPGVARAADPVEDHRRGPHLGVELAKAQQQCAGRLRHAAGVDHQHHRPAGQRRQLGGRAGAARRAVEQPHHPLAQHQLGVRAGPGDQAGQSVAAHRPAVQVEAGPPACLGVERRVDIVGSGLDRGDRDSGQAQMAQQREGHHRLAAARRRRRDQQAPTRRACRRACRRA